VDPQIVVWSQEDIQVCVASMSDQGDGVPQIW